MNEHAQLDWLCINTVRGLSIEAVEKANSGHPGTPMGAAPTAYCLWQRFLRYDPHDPEWSLSPCTALACQHRRKSLRGASASSPGISWPQQRNRLKSIPDS
jgi:transketolase N-terminal domain/subunit